ncbi:ArsR family transcriptional regulator [Actinomadura sp. 21ATH]|uniref:arsenate reductase/protein-tyrosine-phosphatase family protein n=1 Tax=Actinomadura sp. 21ATH TaxID=1735444 RepID=UPI0035C2007D
MVPPGQADPRSFLGLVAHPLRWRLVAELARGDLRVGELVGLVAQPQNLVSYHLRLLRQGGLVTATRSSFDGRDSYYHLDLDRCAHALAGTGAALHPALRMAPAAPAFAPGRPPVTVLFVCTGNSARSPIAEALLRDRTAGRAEVASAGSRPKATLHPRAVQVLRDRYGIDIAGRRPRHLDAVRGRRFDHVITLCDKAREVCPEFGDSARRVHWSIPDPATAGRTEHAAFIGAADDIDTRIRHLLPVLAASEAQQ